MFTHPLRLTGLAASVLVLSFSVHADTSDTGAMLDDVVISASRITPVEESLPVGAVVMTRAELARIPANNLADVLDTVAGVTASRFYGINGSRASVDLLGFGATGTQNTLLLLNGRRLNDVDLAAVDFSAIPVAAIERIEILPASGAVLYGNGAVGGAINIVTRQQYETGAGVEALAGDYDTLGGRLYGSQSFGDQGAGSQSALASLQSFRSDGYRDHNETRQDNAFADWRYNSADINAAVTVLADRQRLNLPGARRVNPLMSQDDLSDNPEGASTPNDWAKQDGVQILPGVELRLSDTLSAHIDGGMRIKRQQYFIDGGFGYTSYTEAETENFSVSPRLTGQWMTGPVGHQWIAGFDFSDTAFKRDVALDESTFNQPIHQVEIGQRTSAVYLHDSMAVTDSTIVSAGIRHEWVYTDATDRYDPAAPTVPCCGDAQAEPFDIRQEAEIWNIGVRQNVGDRFHLFGNVEKSARFASVDEFFELDPVLSVTSLDPLKVQTGRLYSLGAAWQSGGQRSVLTAWQGDFKNEIHYDVGAFENVNLDPTRRQGVSLNTRWQLDNTLWLTLAGSYQRAEFRRGAYAGNEVPLVPRQTGYARFDWSPLSVVTLSIAQRYVGNQFFDNDQSNDFGQRIPSYRRSDLELKATEPSSGAWLKVGVYNLEDKIVFDYGVRSTFTPGVYNAYPLPDRHVMVSLGADF
ncbi:MAG: ligand-gated channel [Gammaproteobacteria bacterium HGW-Gammaproteobacteria-14]|nr:MAG: ligand-gated channel [Gammaproteobacteria bacterium HGW-Gammaproteobacteria-14]